METKDWITVIFSCASLGMSITTLYFSRKISFKKTIKERQFEVVCELMKLLSKTSISFRWKENKGSSGISTMFFYSFYHLNFQEKVKYLFERKNIYYQAKCFELDFISLMGNSLLPTEIYDALDKLRPKQLFETSYEEIESTNDYVAMITLNQKTGDFPYHSTTLEGHKTFDEFSKIIVEIFDTINNWLEQHDGKDLKFKKRKIR